MKNDTYILTIGQISSQHGTHAGAVAAFYDKYPDGDAGHCGDLTNGGDRTLCWADPVDSDGDGGHNAAGEIRMSQ